MTDRRLIESAFPLKQTSLDSVHEKNVRHGHISTLHIWPARRPLAACRAALLATLLPDPETAAERRALCEAIGGTVCGPSTPPWFGGRPCALPRWERGGPTLGPPETNGAGGRRDRGRNTACGGRERPRAGTQGHYWITSMPIDRAVPATVFTAAATSPQFRSGIFSWRSPRPAGRHLAHLVLVRLGRPLRHVGRALEQHGGRRRLEDEAVGAVRVHVTTPG